MDVTVNARKWPTTSDYAGCRHVRVSSSNTAACNGDQSSKELCVILSSRPRVRTALLTLSSETPAKRRKENNNVFVHFLNNGLFVFNICQSRLCSSLLAAMVVLARLRGVAFFSLFFFSSGAYSREDSLCDYLSCSHPPHLTHPAIEILHLSLIANHRKPFSSKDSTSPITLKTILLPSIFPLLALYVHLAPCVPI